MLNRYQFESSVDSEHEQYVEEIESREAVLSEANVWAGVRQPVQAHEDVDEAGRIAAWRRSAIQMYWARKWPI